MSRSAAIAIIDYGMGNLSSVHNAFDALDCPSTIAAQPAQLREAAGIVLPGVGAFGDGMRNLRERGFIEELEKQVRDGGKPFLGLCLGLQLLATRGFEHGENAGLNWIPGVVERLQLPPGLRVPHIGWNDVRFVKKDLLYTGLGEMHAFYFVHSFAFRPDDPRVVSGVCEYGGEFVASIEFENISATQFHPEKSHQHGLSVLRNWARKVAAPC
ncbi:MAG: imidazole glycerol-phosphate synthase subunit HisH [Chthoniobacter sp.]|jgi:glutamine amidotransferase|nr:imidazole glycerol-phosphate synthase subunit HisH [Chthoniobacter sp.]